MPPLRSHALEIFNAAVQAVQPSVLLPKHLRIEKGKLLLHGQEFDLGEWENIFVAGAGKAAAAMAAAAERILGERISAGVVITKHEHGLPLRRIRCLEAGHPVPDESGVRAGEALLELVQGAGERDLVITLISGGASALMADLPEGITLAELQELSALLLRSGATIGEMNAVRKHLSRIKGGGLSRAAWPATIVSFILSDVMGDPPDVIASGPTVPDPTTYAQALDVLQQYGLSVAPSIRKRLEEGGRGLLAETPKPDEKLFSRTHNYLIGSNRIALEAAATRAGALGYQPLILTDRMAGEAREAATGFIRQLRQLQKADRPLCVLMGGETTVTIRGDGKGGRNQEFILAALAQLLKEEGPVPVVLSGGTDGTDGPTDAAGAVIDREGVEAVRRHSLDPAGYLARNDSYRFFRQTGGLVLTGPTQTNVMDIVIALID